MSAPLLSSPLLCSRSAAKPEKLKIYLQGVILVKVRPGGEGDALLAKVGTTVKKVLLGAEAAAFLSRLATFSASPWSGLEMDADLRARCKDALTKYTLMNGA